MTHPAGKLTSSVLLLLSLQLTAAVAADSWPQWRGPAGQGHGDASNLPTEWNGEKNVSWKTELPGRGWSSPVIQGNQVWVTAAHEKLASEEEKKKRLKANTGGQPLIVLEKVSLHAVCLDRKSGKILHDIEVLKKEEPQWVHELNTYASPTPIIEEGRLYCHFGSYGTACVDTASAKVLWQNQDLKVMHENGPGSTPVLWKDRVIFHMDGSDQQFIAALDKKTGKLAWKTARSGEMNKNPQLKKAYGTPLVLKIDGKEHVVSPAADWLYGYDPASGKELWKLSYGILGFSNVPRPVAGHGMIFLSTSFMRAQILAIRYDKSANPSISWRHKRSVPKTSSPILVGKELYFVSDAGGVVTCLDAFTGKVHWQERIKGNHSSSPTYADGKLYFHSREGVTTVIKPGKDKLDVLANNQLPGQHMSSLAISGSALFLRTDKALYRIEKN